MIQGEVICGEQCIIHYKTTNVVMSTKFQISAYTTVINNMISKHQTNQQPLSNMHQLQIDQKNVNNRFFSHTELSNQ